MDRNLCDILDRRVDKMTEKEQSENEDLGTINTISDWWGYHVVFKKTDEGIVGIGEVLCDGEDFDPDKADTFEFHVNYKEELWYPLNRTDLPEISQFENCPRNIYEFPPTTRLGWRGPMVELEKIKDYPILNDCYKY